MKHEYFPRALHTTRAFFGNFLRLEKKTLKAKPFSLTSLRKDDESMQLAVTMQTIFLQMENGFSETAQLNRWLNVFFLSLKKNPG